MADAWSDLYELILAQVVVSVDGRELSVDDALSLRESADRTSRQATDVALHDALRGSVDLVAHCYDTVVADRLMLDEVTGCPGPRHHQDLANQIDSAAVDAALAAVAARPEVAQRWYAAKAAVLGSLSVADLLAPIGGSIAFSFPEAIDIVVAAWDGMDTDLGAVARDLFRTSRVDALPRSGKMGNSLCVPAGSAGAFILTNFTGTIADVLNLAHESGHALHYTMSGRAQPGLCGEPTVLAGEVAANFAELLVADEMIRRTRSGSSYDAITTVSIDALVATVFRQAAYTRFELAAYARRAAGEILLPDRLSALWTDSLQPLYGTVVTGHETHTNDWALVPHFIRSRFYNYAYVVASLTALTLYRRWKEDDRTGAATALRGLLDAGGSADAAHLLLPLGIDCADPDTWQQAMDALDQLIQARLVL